MNKKDSATSTALKLMGEHAVLWDELALSVQASGVQSVPSGPWFPQKHVEVVGWGSIQL